MFTNDQIFDMFDAEVKKHYPEKHYPSRLATTARKMANAKLSEQSPITILSHRISIILINFLPRGSQISMVYYYLCWDGLLRIPVKTLSHFPHGGTTPL